MTDSYANILRKTDPFVLGTTVENLENVAPHPAFALPLGATSATGETDEDRPFLQTPFNKLDERNYRSPWKKSNGDDDVLELEQTANEVWDAYRQLYYGNDAVGSVFVRRKGADARTGTPSKAKKGGSLEALFGIQKKSFGENGSDEIARWDSVHTVTIEVPNFDEGTCEYKIQSAVWCRYKPEDVGDVPKAQRPKPATPPKKKASTSPKKPNSKLDVARLEVFDRAVNNWDNKSNHSKTGGDAAVDLSKVGKNLPPIPAVVTSSAVYTKDTSKVCKLQANKKQTKAIPVASHIQNIGTLLEKIEADVRSKLERVDAPKCVEVLQGMYRPSLSPGLKLPNSTSNSKTSMISKLGGHATGMGVGKGLIGEIALKAKAKGLGNEESVSSSTTTTNKAMENILANEKKKLQDLDDGGSSPSKAPTTWNQTGLKKSKVSPNNKSTSSTSTSTSSNSNSSSFEKPSLRKTNSASASGKAAKENAGPAFLRRSQLRKAASVRMTQPSTPAPTPEFMNFRSKLKSTAAK
eukprot:CAMPEP_0116142754 /NCGR_PEP_ID=MMETSP0329-20121206/15077_1 /TAXON_ID=697910 /ORGANISM="Pseudo-nitzschia arenysensis, Strain B593" /LENGTH=521 /DNA_ID=CAMNT_0003638011 /DNA_START=186 /DNA_END=1751 /DNA_ORIENTATION=-